MVLPAGSPALVPLILAHSVGPQPLEPSELFGDWMLGIVALALAGGMAWINLAPLFATEDPKKRRELAAWTAIALGVLLAMASWITRESFAAAVTPESNTGEHMHFSGHGGQIAMWGDYHAELARVVSGEYRVWLSDKYRRTIGNEYFSGWIYPRNDKTGVVDEAHGAEFLAGLDGEYRLASLPRAIKSVQIRMQYPGGTIRLNFVFDGSRGKRSMPAWCGG